MQSELNQSELAKLQPELEALVEQNKKQTDMLAEIKDAYDKAEAGAQKNEAVIQQQ